MADTKSRRQEAPPALAEIIAARTDYEDVQVASLGGKTLRVHAVSGTARAKLMSGMVGLLDDEAAAKKDPAKVERVLMFQVHVVAASLGYPEEQWAAVGDALGEGAIEQLFDVATRLSRLDKDSADEVAHSLKQTKSTASGTD